MTSEPAGVVPLADARERSAAAIRGAIEREYAPIHHAIGVMVRSVGRGQGREWARQRTEEVFAEAVCRALERSATYDPERSAIPWIVGIARNVMHSEAREGFARPRQADLDEAAWESVLGVIDPGSERALNQLEVERMLLRLTPGHRQAIETRFLRELTGESLARALGVATEGAARVRVCRALQSLRDLFAQDGMGVDR